MKLKTYVCEFDGQEIGTVEASSEEEAYGKMEKEFPEYPYGLYDGVANVYCEEENQITYTPIKKPDVIQSEIKTETSAIW